VDSDAGIKVDVNVSIPHKTERVEIKNINSLDSVGKAIVYELERQGREGSVRETRRYDELKGITISMREKEGQDDYRFIADPDLEELILDEAFVKRLAQQLPQSPEEKLAVLLKKYKVDMASAEILSKHLDIAEFFEAVAQKVNASSALPWVTGELFRLLNEHRVSMDKVDIKVDHFVALINMVEKGSITVLQGKQLLKQFYPKSFMPSKVAEKMSDSGQLESIVDKVFKEQSKAVSDYKSGDSNAFNFLVGAVMKATEKRADIVIVRELLKKKLG
jgi:aspartyl-tRNA(Asn)/glutamyl-tRNA(Gln) amidotransferase subunit B